VEQPFSFTADGGRRHGLLYDGGSPNAAVVAHPHPLFGGEMTSPVVEAVCGAFRQRGWTTLRFNFRGVGKSDGRFDDGPGEARDLAAAVGALSARGAESIALAGYSFGAWVVERHLRGDDASPLVSRVVMVAPPVALLPFPPARPIAALDLIVTGEEDAYAPPAAVRDLCRRWNPSARLVVLDGVDHFYWGALDRLKETVARSLGG
jgi:alpha/beta superfamily hydrolase